MSAVAGLDHCKAELEAVRASGIFAKAPSLALLLEYVCGRYFEGQAHQIKEYNIAVEALGRPETFDPRQDSIVRVEAFRLRKRLKQYYENEGRERPLRILIPSGQYVPQFLDSASADTSAPAPVQGNGEEVPGSLAMLGHLNPDVEIVPVGQHLPSAMAAPRRKASWVVAASVALPLLLAAIVLSILSRSSSPPAKPPTAARATAVPIGTESEEVRIMAGSPVARYVDRTGNIWSADRFFYGGSVFSTPNHIILGTTDPELFRTRREGDFTYDIPLHPGLYEMHLVFAETLFGENNTAGGGESSRVFRIDINNKMTLPSFDVLSDAGGSNTADEKVFKDISPASDGMLHVRFAALVNSAPFLNALEIVPGIPGKMRPVRIVARARNYTDQQGHVWGADRYFMRGFGVARSEPVTNTPDPEIFGAERFGNFVYAIPAAEGRYTVTLKFAETWFGPGHPGGGGPGSRVFDVYCNGTALLRNFDILRAAGGPQRAIEENFHGVTPNAQGKIVLSFVPVVNYACVNAIEVVDESN
ncbi:MAG TPA: malectin domain-containing carbohydrate-binding protein [Bryobacteraceae bacterium]|nr:malectin domain-containing carbohydrate-binding protein [Bryobacteraceae bacterium]